MKKILQVLGASLFALTFAAPAWAIFVNGGFEDNSYNGWTKGFGVNPGLTGSPPFTEANIVINPGGSDHSTIVGATVDPRAPTLVLPLIIGGNQLFSAKVENEANGANLNFIRQSGVITEADRDPVDGKLHVRFRYAAVLEDPNHQPNEQPYFHVSLKNLTKGTTLFDDFTYSDQPGKIFATTVVNGSPWKSTSLDGVSSAPIDVDIIVPDADLGDTLMIETLAADCSLSGHGGYVYLDGFGSAPPPAAGPDPIPTLSEWGMIFMVLLLALLGVSQMRRTATIG